MANNDMYPTGCRSCNQSAKNMNSMDSVSTRELRVVRRNSNNDVVNDNVSCQDLMKAIMEADFMATDLKLYLDIHPDDERALELYRDAVRQYKACKATFEDTFYPLTATSAGRNGTWDWLDGTFPPLS